MMATLEELRNEIKVPLDDASISNEAIDSAINACLRLVARKLLFPALETSGVFTTDPLKTVVKIPVNWTYSRNLFAAAVPDEEKIKVLASVGELAQRYPDYDTALVNSPIEYIVIHGNDIIYYPSPLIATDVTCKYYSTPTPLVKDSDEPTFIPEEMQIDLIVNYVLWKVWARIEDGIEGFKVNTSYHKKEFQEFFDDLDDSIDNGQSRQEPNRESSWI
jgi:hypothetical protein